MCSQVFCDLYILNHSVINNGLIDINAAKYRGSMLMGENRKLIVDDEFPLFRRHPFFKALQFSAFLFNEVFVYCQNINLLRSLPFANSNDYFYIKPLF